MEEALKVHPLDHAEARVLLRFLACAGDNPLPMGDDGLTDDADVDGTANEDRKWVEFVHARRIRRRLEMIKKTSLQLFIT